jgi:hypothetical protein
VSRRDPNKPLTDVTPHLTREGLRIMGGFGNTEQKHGGQRGREFRRDRVDAVHHPYFNAELSGHARQSKPEALFTAGGAASGKSWLTKNRSPKDAVISDPDRAKTGEGVNGHNGIPEFHQLARSGNAKVAAAAVHEESSRMAKEVASRALTEKHNLVVDGVGDSTPGRMENGVWKPGSFEKKVRAAVKAGHSVRVEYMHLPVDKALAREHVRSKRTNRKVNEGTLREGHRESASRFGEIAKVDGVKLRIYSSDVPKGTDPKLIAEGVGGPRGLAGLRVLDRAAYNGFITKGGGKP